MRGFLIFLGLLLILGGGAIAGAQYAEQYTNLDLSALDSVAGATAFLRSPMALYAGGGVAAFGLVLVIIAAATGGKKKQAPAMPASKAAKPKAADEPVKTLTPDSLFDPEPTPAAAPAVSEQEVPRTVIRPAERTPQSVATSSDQPPWSQPTPAASAKPTASAHPPEGYDPIAAARSDPRLHNRKRVTDLVTINDALKAFNKQHGAYPKAEGLLGQRERGDNWIPGLAPDFIPRLPQDPATVSGRPAPQYVYASDGKNYKLLAQGVSLVGGTNVEVLGVRIDPTRRPTAENAAFGFWTPDFASA